MSEWWTYTLSDFLLFSPRTYYRLIELYNAAIWPLHVLAVALAIAIVVLLWCGGAASGRAIAAILAALWLWVAWAFHLERYATINWAAIYFATGCALQALLLVWAGAIRGGLQPRPVRHWIAWAAIGTLLFALIVQPLLGPLAGRAWAQVELFGIAPDPTAIATLGIVLLGGERVCWELLILPIVWCGLSGATLWTMQQPDAAVMPLAALLAAVLAVARQRKRRMI